MKTFPLPAVVAALASLLALPFDVAASGTLFLTAGLGFIIHADFALRCRRVRLPRRAIAPAVAFTAAHPSRRATEPHRLAA